MISKIVVAGAGTMGSGIALSFALKGFKVVVYDSFPGMTDKAKASINSNLEFLLSKQKISALEKEKAENKLSYSQNINDCTADMVIEAIIEDENAKAGLFKNLAALNSQECIIVSNTSSLSINALQKHIPFPGRFAGLHFFNPAHVMKLVEVIQGAESSGETMGILTALCKQIGKEPVTCIDSPGFIVNRVARHYYLEAMRISEMTNTNPETIDEVLEATGFKMGPFKLMDMIGMDINLAVSRSLYNAFNKERFRPSKLQIEKVEKGELGRKTGKGFYNYEKK